MISKIKAKFKSKKQSTTEVSVSTSQSNSISEYKFLEQLPMAAAVFDLKGNYKYVNDEYIIEEKFKKEILGKDDAFYFDLINVSSECADRRKDIPKST